jgi:hypothetical protein
MVCCSEEPVYFLVIAFLLGARLAVQGYFQTRLGYG